MYAFLAPEAAARVRTTGPVQDRPEARTGLPAVRAQVLKAQDRSFYAEPAKPAREHLPSAGLPPRRAKQCGPSRRTASTQQAPEPDRRAAGPAARRRPPVTLLADSVGA
ncbi:hypothetical protein ACXNSR_03315 [Streptomyces sp. NC-S4]